MQGHSVCGARRYRPGAYCGGGTGRGPTAAAVPAGGLLRRRVPILVDTVLDLEEAVHFLNSLNPSGLSPLIKWC